jgi:hypothetical protein
MTYEPQLLVAQPNFTINDVSSLYWRVSWSDAIWWVCPPLPYLNVDTSESCTSLIGQNFVFLGIKFFKINYLLSGLKHIILHFYICLIYSLPVKHNNKNGMV